MKLLIYRVNTKENKRTINKKPNIEKILISLFIFSFSALILVQAILLDPSVRANLIIEEVLGGTPLGAEETLYNQGIIVLEVMGSLPDTNNGMSLKVLINGEPAASFKEESLQLQIIDGDVIEIDGSDYKQELGVVIRSGSENINSEYLGKSVTVFSNVKKLAKIRIAD